MDNNNPPSDPSAVQHRRDEAIAAAAENPGDGVTNHNEQKKKMKAKRKDGSSTSSGFSLRRNAKVVVNAARRNPNSDNIGFRLGMSFAAFVNQILERNVELGGGLSPDHLAKICASAVRESLANDFGNTFDCFIQNFEQSFGSTLRTLKSIKESSDNNTGYLSRNQNMEGYSPLITHEEHDDLIRREGCRSSSTTEDHHSMEKTEGPINYRYQLNQDMLTSSGNLEVDLHDQASQLICIPPKTVESMANQSMLDTFEKSVIEQARANELKMWELRLKMKNLSLKEERVALRQDSNYLERFKIAMGKSKASFKAEKFKTQLEDTRHLELLRKCIDCLVAGLLVMAAALFYGTYVYSYRRIAEAAASCVSSKESKSWWNPMSSFNSGFQVLKCQAEVVSRMLFGFFMILAIAYLILQRTAGSRQTMPVTFIILLLGIACGWAGKFCVDTLGGSGYHWLIYWETLCLLHFFCNVYTSVVFYILHGPVDVTQGTKGKSIFPYWMRRLLFYGIAFLFLPLLCGLLPFASVGEWKHHFLLLVTDVDYLI